jgi:hypothetical protein
MYPMYNNNNYYYYYVSSLGPVWVGTIAQSGDLYGSGTLYPGQVLRGSLPLLSPSEVHSQTMKKSISRIHPVLINSITFSYTYCCEPKQYILFPLTPATCFGDTVFRQ